MAPPLGLELNDRKLDALGTNDGALNVLGVGGGWASTPPLGFKLDEGTLDALGTLEVLGSANGALDALGMLDALCSTDGALDALGMIDVVGFKDPSIGVVVGVVVFTTCSAAPLKVCVYVLDVKNKR